MENNKNKVFWRLKLNKKKWYSTKLLLLIIPFMVLLFLFTYYPLYGWIYAFYDYHPPIPLNKSRFMGLYWFQSIFENETKRRYLFNVMRNTFVMSGLGILTSWFPMAFAIFLNEFRNTRYKKIVQTLTTIPNFISWVLVYFMAFSIFSNTGVVNNWLVSIGAINTPINFLDNPENTWLSMFLWSTWKSLGWGAIMYLAAIAGINQELYDVAKVDGAGRFQLMKNVTIPGLTSTFFVLLLLSIANFLNNGMEQYFVFQGAFNKEKIQVLDLYVYNLGMGSGKSYSLATSVSILKSLVSVTLLFIVNKMSKKIRGQSII